MKAISSTASPSLLSGSWSISGRQVSKRVIFPLALVLLALVGILSPLFDLHQVHGFPGAKLYSQHLFFDGIADAGGFYASTFCKHWYHRVPIAIGFALVSTLALVTLVG
jgi:hypothetical protein